MLKGHFLQLSAKQAQVRLEQPVAAFANLKMRVSDTQGNEVAGALYGKVLDPGKAPTGTATIRFTSMSPEIEAFFNGLLGEPVEGTAKAQASTNGSGEFREKLGRSRQSRRSN